MAFPLLWRSEQDSAKNYDSLNEVLGLVVSVNAENIESKNNGRLVHVQGFASTDQILTDEAFNISVKAIKLQRQVQMYQWTESAGKTGSFSRRDSDYRKSWRSEQIDSSDFELSWHRNPIMSYKTRTLQASRVSLGKFKLNESQVSQIGKVNDFMINAFNIPTQLAGKKVKVTNDSFYLGNNPYLPEIGDLKVKFTVVYPTNISIIAQQQADSFTGYQTKAGEIINLLNIGLMDIKAMYSFAQSDNTFTTWEFRVVFFLLMWLGLCLVIDSFSEVPSLNNLIAMGIGIVTFFMAISYTSVIIALAWMLYRPLFSGSLIVGVIALILVMKLIASRRVNKLHHT